MVLNVSPTTIGNGGNTGSGGHWVPGGLEFTFDVVVEAVVVVDVVVVVVVVAVLVEAVVVVTTTEVVDGSSTYSQLLSVNPNIETSQELN